MLFQVFKNGMILLLYRDVNFKVIAPSLPMVYCVLKNILSCRCHVINVIWSEEVIIQGQVSLPVIALPLTNHTVCPSGIIYKYDSQLPPICIPIIQVWYSKRAVCFQSYSSKKGPANKIRSLEIIYSLLLLSPFNGSSASAVGTSCFLTTYDSGVLFTPHKVRRYSSTISNFFDQSLVCTVGVVT